jgi:5-formyltetrahydrofolate cyclo-ligase
MPLLFQNFMTDIPASLEEQKRILRATMRGQRLGQAGNIPNASNMLRDVFQAHVKLERNLTIGGYIAFNGEADPSLLIEALRGAGHQISLPRVTGKDLPLSFHIHKTGDMLVPHEFGVMEPPADAPPAAPDVLLVPLLAFDSQRNRLGYGGGYYDRTIAALRLRKAVIAIGIGYDFQCVKSIPTDAHDIKMDKIVTEVSIIKT